jgi:hypothetical protein
LLTIASGTQGVIVGTGLAVHAAAQDEYPSRGAISMAGAAAGLGFGLTAAVETTNNAWYWVAGGFSGSVIGAVVLDRLTAQSPSGLSLMPWTPGGRPGLLAQAAF